MISSRYGQEFLDCWLWALSKAHRRADQPDAGESFAASESRCGGGRIRRCGRAARYCPVRGEDQVGAAPGDEGPAVGGSSEDEHEVEILAELCRHVGGGGDRVGEGAAHAVHDPVVLDVPATVGELGDDLRRQGRPWPAGSCLPARSH